MGVILDSLVDPGSVRGFLPWLWEFSAMRSGLDISDLVKGPSELVAAVTSASQIVESDALVVVIEEVRESVLEGLHRMVSSGGSRDVVALVPGVMSLGRRRGLVDVDERDDAALDMARAVLQTGTKVLAFDEPNPDPEAGDCYRIIARLASYYRARTLAIAPPSATYLLEAGLNAIDGGTAGPAASGVPVATTCADPAALTITTTPWPAEANNAYDLRSIARRVHTARARQ